MQRVRDDRKEFLNQSEAIQVAADLLVDNDDAVPEDLSTIGSGNRPRFLRCLWFLPR
jgi:hypothetical protein